MSTRPNTRNRANEFIRGLERVDRSRSTRDSFRDLIELAYLAFAKLTAPTAEHADRLEARYMTIVGRYEDKTTIRAYPELLALAMDAVYSERTDFLGRVAAELEVLDPGAGQFFTPYELALCMAQINFAGAAEAIREKGYVTIQEPAAGAGGMLLAFAQALEDAQFDPATTMLAHAVDVNSLAFQMCFLQLTWRKIPALVQLGNSLSMEIRESAWTSAAWTFHGKHGHLFPTDEPGRNAAESDAQPPAEAAPEQLAVAVVQLQLF